MFYFFRVKSMRLNVKLNTIAKTISFVVRDYKMTLKTNFN